MAMSWHSVMRPGVNPAWPPWPRTPLQPCGHQSLPQQGCSRARLQLPTACPAWPWAPPSQALLLSGLSSAHLHPQGSAWGWGCCGGPAPAVGWALAARPGPDEPPWGAPTPVVPAVPWKPEGRKYWGNVRRTSAALAEQKDGDVFSETLGSTLIQNIGEFETLSWSVSTTI